jgi:hypothetical protein
VGQARIEKILTGRRAKNASLNLRAERKDIRAKLKPSAAHFEMLRASFLLAHLPVNAGRFSVTFEDVMREVALAADRPSVRDRSSKRR